MSLTVEQLLVDARRLSTRLKDHDHSADQLITRSQEVLKEVESMRQYQENIENLNEIAHNRPRAHLVLGIQQENRHIRSLQQENKELRASLEEYQSALEMIMSKYRVQVSSLMNSSGRVEYGGQSYDKLLQEKTEKVCEMAAVMKAAVRLDQEKEEENNKLIARLHTENKGLRELLGISRQHQSLPVVKKPVINVDQGVQTEGGEGGLRLEVTLPLPAPPPRLNRPAAQTTLQTKPTTPEFTETESRLSASPVDPSTGSASESDETSDDDSVKYDTIKLSRRRTVIPASEEGPRSRTSSETSNPGPEPAKPAPEPQTTSAIDQSNKTNNNQPENLPSVAAAPSTASPSLPGLKTSLTASEERSHPTLGLTTDSSLVAPSSPELLVSETSSDTYDATGDPEQSTAVSAVAAETSATVETAAKSMTVAESMTAAESMTTAESMTAAEVAVTNCSSILNDIITDSMNSSSSSQPST